MDTFYVHQRVRVIEPVDVRYRQVGTILYISDDGNDAIICFDDGEELGYLLDDDEVEPI